MTNPNNPLNIDPATRAWALEIKNTAHGIVAAYKAGDWEKLSPLLEKLHTGNSQEVTMMILSELIPVTR